MVTKSIHDRAESSYSAQDVVSQLNAILAHDLFCNSPVLSTFLKYIVEETVNGNLTSLKEYTIGVNGLGKKADFNPQIDAIVRIHAGRLRRLLADYYKDAGKHDKILIEVVKGSYVPVFSVRYSKQEMPKTLRLSLEGIKQVTVSKATLAILPFRNVSPHGDHQFFVDGLGEEFTRLFSTSKEFAVVGHHSTLKYSVEHTNLHTIGAKLHAQYIISGTVMRHENHFRVNVSLAETQLSTQLWSNMFDYPPDADIVEVLDETAQHAYAALGGPFGFIIRHRAAAGPKTSDDAAVEFDPAVWNYNFHVHFSFFNYAKTRRVLELMLQNDPAMTGALAMLSELYMWGHVMGFPTAEDAVATSLQLAHKAVNGDPADGHARFAFLWAALYHKGKEATVSEIGHVVQTQPHSAALGMLGVVLVCAGAYDDAQALIEDSIRQSPHYPWSMNLALCLVHLHHRRYANALGSIERIEATDIYLVDLLKILLYRKAGMDKEARPLQDSLMEKYPFIELNLKARLQSFLLDDQLIDHLLQQFRQAGIAS